MSGDYLAARVIESIEESAQKIAENFDLEDDERLSIVDAATKIGVSIQSVANWIAAQRIPSEKIAGKRYILMSIVEAVRELRETHGVRWHEHAPWNGLVRPDETIVGEPETEREIVEDETEDISEESLRVFKRLIERARELYAEGRYRTSCELVWTAFDEFQILN